MFSGDERVCVCMLVRYYPCCAIPLYILYSRRFYSMDTCMKSGTSFVCLMHGQSIYSLCTHIFHHYSPYNKAKMQRRLCTYRGHTNSLRSPSHIISSASSLQICRHIRISVFVIYIFIYTWSLSTPAYASMGMFRDYALFRCVHPHGNEPVQMYFLLYKYIAHILSIYL